ncbi:uncharacterized protein KIAA1958-like [Glandiceps talaboti]
MWSLTVWETWRSSRNDRIVVNNDGASCEETYSRVPALDGHLRVSELVFWLCRFVEEVRRSDGSEYPAPSLRALCMSFQRHLQQTCNRKDLHFMDTYRTEFRSFHETLRRVSTDLNRRGVGPKKRYQPCINEEEEKRLWDKVFSKEISKYLSYAVYFYTFKLFHIRSSEKHLSLQASHFVFYKDDKGEFLQLHCVEDKFQRRSNRKVYRNADSKRCIYTLFIKYLHSIPPQGPFYRRPLPETNGKVRYSDQRLGRSSIRQYLKKMCDIAGIIRQSYLIDVDNSF